MKRTRWLTVLMIITLVIITGFQVYWLAFTYQREKSTLKVKANSIFENTVGDLQVSKLNFTTTMSDTTQKGVRRIIVKGRTGKMKLKNTKQPGKEIVTLVNAIRDKVIDSTRGRHDPAIMFSMDEKRRVRLTKDSFNFRGKPGGSDDRILNVLYGIDSLQDSITLPEIATALNKNLSSENII